MDERELNIYRSILADKKVEIERLKSMIAHTHSKSDYEDEGRTIFIIDWINDLISDYCELSKIISIYEQQEDYNDK